MNDSAPLPRVRFAQRERRGAFLGLSWIQILVICPATLSSVIWLLVDWNTFWAAGIWPALILIGAGSWTWHRESGLAVVWRVATFAGRHRTGQTRFKRDVWDTRKDTTMRIGRRRHDQKAPYEVIREKLPGPYGALRLVQIPGAGAFIINPKTSVVSFSADVLSSAWPLLDEGTQLSAYDGFVDWMSGLEAVPGLIDATARIRVDAKPATQLADYARARDSAITTPVSAALRDEYEALISDGAQRSMGFTNTLTLTCDLRTLRSAIKHSGGGLVGIGTIVQDLVTQLADSLTGIGVELRTWLDAPALDAALSLATSPTCFVARPPSAPVADHPPVMGILELWDHIQIDKSVHRTFWIAEWPRSETRVGFLDKLLYAGDATRVLTLSVHPIPIHTALGRVGRAKVDLEIARGLRQRRGMITTREQDREYEDLEDREDDIVDGFTDMEFRGFITVSADDLDGLERASAAIRQAAQPSRVTLAAMYFQQASSFLATALPLPAAKR